MKYYFLMSLLGFFCLYGGETDLSLSSAAKSLRPSVAKRFFSQDEDNPVLWAQTLGGVNYLEKAKNKKRDFSLAPLRNDIRQCWDNNKQEYGLCLCATTTVTPLVIASCFILKGSCCSLCGMFTMASAAICFTCPDKCEILRT